MIKSYFTEDINLNQATISDIFIELIKYIDECPYLDFQQKNLMRKCIEHNSQLMNRLYFSLIRCQVWENLGEKKRKQKILN